MSVTDGIGQTPCSQFGHLVVFVFLSYVSCASVVKQLLGVAWGRGSLARTQSLGDGAFKGS